MRAEMNGARGVARAGSGMLVAGWWSSVFGVNPEVGMRTLVAIPVFNEAGHVRRVVSRVLDFVGNVLVVDDGSTDATPDLVREFPDLVSWRDELYRRFR